MNRPSEPSDPIYSVYDGDPDLGELVELFVEEMPGRVGNLVDRLAQRDWQGLGTAAHQLKGAAGSYGFYELTQASGRLDLAVREGRPEPEVRLALERLVGLCRRARYRSAAMRNA